jgi:hypothetical protein
MKTNHHAQPIAALGAVCLSLCAFLGRPACAAADPSAPSSIGIYDSRVIAYAWFWSETGTHQRNEIIAAARAAKATGDEAAAKAASAVVSAFQEHNHLQVFSTAPVDEILAELAPKLPAILQQAGLTCLVSMWDEATLQSYAGARQVDMTDALVAALFTPNQKQAAVIAEIKRQQPLPLEKARELVREGKL